MLCFKNFKRATTVLDNGNFEELWDDTARFTKYWFVSLFWLDMNTLISTWPSYYIFYFLNYKLYYKLYTLLFSN